MVAANNAYERVNKNERGETKKPGDKGWVSPEAAIEAYNEQVRAGNAKVAPTAIKAYNDKASIYEQVVQKRGQPLREGFTIVKVRAARLACMCSLSQWPDGGPAVRRSREMRMHVLAFPMAGRWSGRSEIARDIRRD